MKNRAIHIDLKWNQEKRRNFYRQVLEMAFSGDVIFTNEEFFKMNFGERDSYIRKLEKEIQAQFSEDMQVSSNLL